MKSDVPKQFLTLRERPVLEYSVRCFCELPDSIRGGLVLVSHPDYLDRSAAICELYREKLRFLEIVAGGETRHDSSKNGLAALHDRIGEDDTIMVHDGARPLITVREVEDLYYALIEQSKAGCATLAAGATETIAIVDPDDRSIQEVPDRSTLFAIKTPQAIKAQYVGRFLESKKNHYTDLISWAMDAGIPSLFAEASEHNIKLTHPGDLPVLESLLK